VTGGPDKKPWGGRFEEAQAPLFERLNASLPFDHVLAPFDVAGSKAHVRMLASIGVLTTEERDTLLSGLEQVLSEVEAGVLRFELDDEDIHMAVERRLTEIVGPLGGKVHTGRSRNDQVALDLQLYLREAVRGHVARTTTLLQTLLDQATTHTQVLLPGYTHLQRAQPVSLAFHLLAYFFMLMRDAERLCGWFSRSWMPLGAGALAGVNYPLDREAVAAELGFRKVAPNAMDAVASRDVCFEYLAVTTTLALTLSRLAEEIVLWTSAEFGFARLSDAWSSGSSIMPQKRNPDGAELVRAKAAGFLGRLTSLGTLIKGLPLAYNKDLQEDKLYVFASRHELDLCLESLHAMLNHLSFRPVEMRRAAEGGYAQATDVADYLVGRGLPFREAHRVVGRLVAVADAEGKALSAFSVEELEGFSPLFDEDVSGLMTLEKVVEAKRSPGGTAPPRVTEQLREASFVLEHLRAEGERLSGSRGPA
jgi:argininosuccinate lyase